MRTRQPTDTALSGFPLVNTQANRVLMNTLRRPSVLSLAAAFIFWAGLRVSISQATARPGPLWTGAKNVVIGIPLADDAEPAVIIRIKEVRKDYETRGFFRIGLLPVEVLQGVAVEINRPESVSKGLAKCFGCFSARRGDRLVFRDFQLIVHASNSVRLTSASARLLPAGRLELLGPISLMVGTNRWEAGGAVLQMTGARAGELSASTPFLRTSLVNPAPIGRTAGQGRSVRGKVMP